MSESIVYVLTLRARSGAQRRLYFDSPRGSEAHAAYHRVRRRAQQMRDEFDDLIDATAALRAFAAEHGLRGLAH